MKGDVPIYEDGKHYDAMVHFEDDVSFYKECVEEYGEPVLELACGTGRVMIPLAEEGIEVIGLDTSDHRLGLAGEKMSKKGVDIDIIKADMRDFSLDEKFGTIILPANSLQVLTDFGDFEKLFSNIHSHLKDDGRFIFQIFNPDLGVLTRDPDEEFDAAEYEDPYDGGKIQITERSKYRSSRQVLDIDWYFHKDDELLETWDWQLRIIFPKEIDALLKYNGFEIEKKYGDTDRSDFEDDSKTQIIICKKR